MSKIKQNKELSLFIAIVSVICIPFLLAVGCDNTINKQDSKYITILEQGVLAGHSYSIIQDNKTKNTFIVTTYGGIARIGE